MGAVWPLQDVSMRDSGEMSTQPTHPLGSESWTLA